MGDPDFLPHVATNIRVCGFSEGKPHWSSSIPSRFAGNPGEAPPSLFATLQKKRSDYTKHPPKALYQGTTLVVAKTATIDGLSPAVRPSTAKNRPAGRLNFRPVQI